MLRSTGRWHVRPVDGCTEWLRAQLRLRQGKASASCLRRGGGGAGRLWKVLELLRRCSYSGYSSHGEVFFLLLCIFAHAHVTQLHGAEGCTVNEPLPFPTSPFPSFAQFQVSSRDAPSMYWVKLFI